MHPGMIAVQLKIMGITAVTDDEQVMQPFDNAAEIAEQEFVACHFLSPQRNGLGQAWRAGSIFGGPIYIRGEDVP